MDNDHAAKDTNNTNHTTTSNNSYNHSEEDAGDCRLLCWGCGEFGQHCHGHTDDVGFQKAEIDFYFGSGGALGAITSISCGSSHTVAITDQGKAFAWGNGNSGQLGCGDQQPQWTPRALTLTPPPGRGVGIRTVACGSRHTMLLLDNGHVYSFGNNFYAQLGYNFRQKNYKENQVLPQFLEFLKHRKVRKVACGDRHSLFLFDDGTVSAVGNNSHGQIGDGTQGESTVPKAVELEHAITDISCGTNHNLAITESGDVYAWGYGKACGKRRHDVLSPELVSFKGKQIVQVSGGSSHSVALTAGGHVYAWGFGVDGQLGLGSIAMATRPRRLRHDFLQQGASSVACGDVYTTAITVFGRLYMWGKNSHTIHEDQDSSYQVRDPRCMNPEPGPPVRHVACGAWHAAALTGLPDFQIVTEESESDSCEEESNGSESSSQLSNGIQRDDLANPDGVDRSSHLLGLSTNGVEVSVPPQSTNSKGMSSALPAPRAKTKLTIGEFYATTSESMSSCGKVSPPVPSAELKDRDGLPLVSSASSQPRVVPLVVEMPPAPFEPESDHEEALPVSTREEMMLDDDDGVFANPNPSSGGGLLPRLSPQKGERGSRTGSHRGWTPGSGSVSGPSKSESPSEWPTNVVVEEDPAQADRVDDGEEGGPGQTGFRKGSEGLGGGGRAAGEVSTGGQMFVGPRSRTSFVPGNSATVQVSRTAAKNFSLPRERSVVVSKSMDILDASQLLSPGTAGGGGRGKVSVPIPGKPYGSEQPGPYFFHDSHGPFAFGLDDVDDFDFDYLEASPRHYAAKDMAAKHIPTHQLDGDFGERGDGMTLISRSRSALTSRDLHWIDQLLLQKVISQTPGQVKRSTSFFGALSGQRSRSPTKFFKKPTPCQALSRTTTPAKTPTPGFKTRTIVNLGAEGVATAGKGAEAAATGTRSTRGLGVMESGRQANSRAGSSSQRTAPSPHQATVPSSRREAKGAGPSAKLPFFSSASSWQKRPGGLLEDLLLDEGKIQSAPSSSKSPGRKRVAFADDQRANMLSDRSNKPTLAEAVAVTVTNAAAAASVGARRPVVDAVLGGGGGLPSRQNMALSHHIDHNDSSETPGGGRLAQASLGVFSINQGSVVNATGIHINSHSNPNGGGGNASKYSRHAPVLAYRTTTATAKADSSTAKSRSQQAQATRTGVVRSSLSGTHRANVYATTDQRRSGSSQLMISGSAGLSRKSRYD